MDHLDNHSTLNADFNYPSAHHQDKEEAIHPPPGVATMKKKYATQIGIGINKYYCADPKDRTLQVEQYPIGFFLSFPSKHTSFYQQLEIIIKTYFQKTAYLESHDFESDCFAFIYFQKAKQLNQFLSKLAQKTYFEDGFTNEELTLSHLKKQAILSYKIALA